MNEKIYEILQLHSQKKNLPDESANKSLRKNSHSTAQEDESAESYKIIFDIMKAIEKKNNPG